MSSNQNEQSQLSDTLRRKHKTSPRKDHKGTWMFFIYFLPRSICHLNTLWNKSHNEGYLRHYISIQLTTSLIFIKIHSKLTDNATSILLKNIKIMTNIFRETLVDIIISRKRVLVNVVNFTWYVRAKIVKKSQCYKSFS